MSEARTVSDDLPPGFVLQPRAGDASSSDLPPGFVLQPRAEKQEEGSGGLAGIWDGLVSGIKRMGAGMTGEDVSRAGRFGMGVADPVYGGAQIGARMMAQPGGGVPEQAGAPPGPDLTKQVDTAVQQRETGYQQREKAAGLDGGLGTEWARILGNVAGTAPLAALPGGAATVPGRIGSAAAGGALGSATMPVAGGDFVTEKAKEIAEGLIGGAALGGAAEGAGSILGRAIASGDPNAVVGAFRRVVKPGTGVARNEPQLTTQDNRILTAVDQIIARNPREADPKSLREFAASIDNTKRGLFEEYDAHARAAGNLGVQVDLKPAITKLREIAKQPEVEDLHPRLPAEAELLAQNLEKRGFYTPSAAQDFIENVNQTLHAFYKNPTEQSVSRATLLAPVVSTMREELDKAITGATGPGYQILRDRYGALKSIEGSVSKAVQREAQKIPGGIAGQFADLASTEQFIHGILRLNPSAVVNAITIRGAKAAIKKLNEPNRAIEQMFRQRRATTQPQGGPFEGPAGAFQQKVGQGVAAARPYATGVGGLIGGEGLANRISGGPTSTYRYRGGLGRDRDPELIGTPVGR